MNVLSLEPKATVSWQDKFLVAMLACKLFFFQCENFFIFYFFRIHCHSRNHKQQLLDMANIFLQYLKHANLCESFHLISAETFVWLSCHWNQKQQYLGKTNFLLQCLHANCFFSSVKILSSSIFYNSLS